MLSWIPTKRTHLLVVFGHRFHLISSHLGFFTLKRISAFFGGAPWNSICCQEGLTKHTHCETRPNASINKQKHAMKCIYSIYTRIYIYMSPKLTTLGCFADVSPFLPRRVHFQGACVLHFPGVFLINIRFLKSLKRDKPSDFWCFKPESCSDVMLVSRWLDTSRASGGTK